MESEPETAPTDVMSSVESPAAPHKNEFSRNAQGKWDMLFALAAGIAYLIFQQILFALRLTNQPLLTTLSLISLLISLLFTVRMARGIRSPLSQFVSLALFLVVMLPFVLLPFIPLHTRAQALAARHFWTGYLTVFHAVPGLQGLLLICLAVSFGVAVSRLVREIKILLPIAVVLVLIDLYVVFGGGLVTQANSGKSPVAKAAMASLTVPLTPQMPKGIPSPPPLLVGFADYLFIALFFACFARFGMPARRTFLILCGVLCVYLLIVVAGRVDLPALVPIGAVVIGSNIGAFRYERSEAFALLYAGLIVIAVLGFFVFLSHRK